MRTPLLIAALAFAGCGGSITEPRNEVVQCGDTPCEIACRDSEAGGGGMCAAATNPITSETTPCAGVVSYMGLTGCCVGFKGTIRFFECEP